MVGSRTRATTHKLSQQANLCPLPASHSIQIPTHHTNRESSTILRISTIIHTTPTHSLATSMTLSAWLSIAHAPSLPGLALPMPSQTELLATLTKHPRHTGSTHSLPTSRTLSAWRSMAHAPYLPLWLCQYGDNSYRNCLELNCPATLPHPQVKRSIVPLEKIQAFYHYQLDTQRSRALKPTTCADKVTQHPSNTAQTLRPPVDGTAGIARFGNVGCRRISTPDKHRPLPSALP